MSIHVTPRLRYWLCGKRFHDRKHWTEDILEAFFEDQESVTVSTEEYAVHLGGVDVIPEFEEGEKEKSGEDAAEYIADKFWKSRVDKNLLDIIENDDTYEFRFEMAYTLRPDATEDEYYASNPDRKTEITGSLAVEEDIDAYLAEFEPTVEADGGQIQHTPEQGNVEQQGARNCWIGTTRLHEAYNALVHSTDSERPISADEARELIAHSADTVRMELPVYILSPSLKNREGGLFNRSPRTLENGNPADWGGKSQGYTYTADEEGVSRNRDGAAEQEERDERIHPSRRGPKFDPEDVLTWFNWVEEEYGFEEITVSDIGRPCQYKIYADVDETIEWGKNQIAIDETITYKGRIARGYADSIESVLNK